jgi:hypothetical protein
MNSKYWQNSTSPEIIPKVVVVHRDGFSYDTTWSFDFSDDYCSDYCSGYKTGYFIGWAKGQFLHR